MSSHEAGAVPRGIEVLVKKAAVDAEFKALLLDRRAGTATEIGLALEPSEAAMLAAIPASQLEAIIEGTKVDEKARPAFLGRAAAVMIAALGVSAAGCDLLYVSETRGIQPDRPPNTTPAPAEEAERTDEKTDERPSDADAAAPE